MSCPVHGELLRGTRGGATGPGEFRRIQNWLGGPGPAVARYVPPPVNEVPAAMADLEKFLQGKPVAMPVLIRAALAHPQFETIHPFLDGNGRLGRLLVTLMLCSETADGEERVLSRPLLYLSFHLKRHRDTYYERLQAIRTNGDWEGWLRFFLEGVISVADLAGETTKRIVELIGILRELTGRSRNKIFAYDEYLKILSEGTEPL